MFVKNNTKCDHRVGKPVVGYTQNSCPRCMGTGWYGGFDFTPAGKTSIVSGGAAVIQKIQKILAEKKRPSGYGFDFDLLRASSLESSNLIKYEINRCLTYLVVSQQQEKQQGVMFNPSEEIISVLGIDVTSNVTDPRSVIAAVSVMTKSGIAVSTTVGIRR